MLAFTFVALRIALRLTLIALLLVPLGVVRRAAVRLNQASSSVGQAVGLPMVSNLLPDFLNAAMLEPGSKMCSQSQRINWLRSGFFRPLKLGSDFPHQFVVVGHVYDPVSVTRIITKADER
jgi:hypothetical protein